MALGNSCNCKAVPGSNVTCSANQLAICRFDGLTCHHECRDSIPIDFLRTALARLQANPNSAAARTEAIEAARHFSNLMLDRVLQTTLPFPFVLEALRAQTFVGASSNDVYSFELPDDWKDVLKDLQAATGL